jgi:Outer membrane protein beta-barrel domain
MRKWSALLILGACTSTLAFAQSAEISVNGGVSRFSGDYATVGGGDNTVLRFTNGFRLVFRFTWNQGKLFSHEIGYQYAKTHLKTRGAPEQDVAPISLHGGLYNFLINATPEGSRVRPFATGGVQFTTFYPPGASTYYGGTVTKFGVNYGFGLKLKLTSIWGIRGDFRQYAMPRPDFGFANKSGWMRQNEMTGGFMFMF